MKCLTLRQPFAELVVSGRKTIETRKWDTEYRGKFLVHAAARRPSKADCEKFGLDAGSLTRGAIIGEAVLVKVKEYKSNAKFKGDKKRHLSAKDFVRYGFVLRNAKRRRRPTPWKSRQGKFLECTCQKKKVTGGKNAAKAKGGAVAKITDDEIITEIIDEEYRYQWIGRH